MNDPTNPATPATPTSDEATALALLDARGRQAATSLRSAVDQRMVDTGAEVLPPAAGGAPPFLAGAAGTDGTDDPDPDIAVVSLHPAAPRRGHGRTWLIAAAVLAVLGLVAAVTLLRQAGDEDAVAGDAPGYLVPGWMPDGWDLEDARAVQISDVPGALTGTVTVYGDPAADDPWTGPRLSIWQTADDGLGFDENAGVEHIEVGGLPATIEEREGTTIVRVLDGDDLVMVRADQTGRPDVLAAAEAAVAGDVAGARPDGWERLARGPMSAASATGTFALDGVSLMYGGSSSANGQVAVIQQAGDRDDAELVRLASTEVEVVEVRGQPAYLVEGALVQWYEPSAHVVMTLMASDLDRSTLLRFAEGLRPSRPGEVDDLVRSHGSSGPFGRLQPGEVVVTEGRFPEGQPWRLVASDDGSDGFGLAFADGAGSSGTGVDAASGWGTLSVDVASHQMAGASGVIGIYGAVTPQASQLVIEAPGHEPIDLQLHMVEGIAGWVEKVFAALVPTDLGSAEVVARAADGSELARVPLDLEDGGMSSGGSTDGPIPVEGGGDDGTSDTTCRTLPDGGEECTSSSSGSAAPGG